VAATRARLKDALALETNGQLADAVRLYLDIYTRHQANDLGQECAPHLAASAFSLHLLKPTAMPIERALSFAQEASRRHPWDVHVRRVLGNLYERARRWDEAVAALEAALAALSGTALDERRAMVHFDLAHVFQCSGDAGRSREQLERVAAFAGTRYGAFRAGILARLRLGRYEAFAELDAHHSLTHERQGHGWPVWRGEPLQGRLLVDTEAWGFGDIWQHLRWIPLAQARVGAVTVLAPPTVAPMVRDQFAGLAS
jgi:tetratricopeptide (TPR) repeat protein